MSGCVDPRCSEGITWCAGCNGYGWLTAGGRKYKMRGQGRNIGATAVEHEQCGGTGLAVCGCRQLDPIELDVVMGRTPATV
jgi:hypothetical protein